VHRVGQFGVQAERLSHVGQGPVVFPLFDVDGRAGGAVGFGPFAERDVALGGPQSGDGVFHVVNAGEGVRGSQTQHTSCDALRRGSERDIADARERWLTTTLKTLFDRLWQPRTPDIPRIANGSFFAVLIGAPHCLVSSGSSVPSCSAIPPTDSGTSISSARERRSDPCAAT